MNQKAEQKERTHEDILTSAARLVRERGVSGARVAEVMAGAGLTVGGFYAHFSSKESLVDEVLRRTAREMRERLFGKLDEKPAEARLEVVLKRYLSARHRDAPSSGCPLPAVVGEIAHAAPEHREALSDHVSSLARELEVLLPERSAGSARSLALALVALMYGGLTLARALGPSELSDELLRGCRALGRLLASALSTSK